MDSTMTTSEILSLGMKCLIDALGAVGAERFVSVLIREKFDYTKWQMEYFGGMTDEEARGSVDEFLRTHSRTGNAKIVL